jgi:Smr domain-containing protein
VRDFDEIDLHGYTITEALSAFVAFYNARVARGNTSHFSVIHGYGSTGNGGQIRKRLRKYLSRFPDRVEFVPGGQYSGNPGITIVAPKEVLPSEEEGLAGEIIAFCANGKSEEKIIGKFRRYGMVEVKSQLRTLERKGSLRSYVKGRYKYYQITSGGN